MKKYIAAIVLAIFSIMPLSLYADGGRRTVGLLGGYNGELESGLAGVYFQYRCNSWLRLTPDVQMLFKKNDRSAFHINGNAHFILPFGGKFKVYALGGITYQSWRYSNIQITEDQRLQDVTSNRFGTNLGGGLEVRALQALKLFAEAKYSFVKDYSSMGISVGIGYVF
ncbi:MAG: outer membrane protein [Muribaculaceae bacterium]